MADFDKVKHFLGGLEVHEYRVSFSGQSKEGGKLGRLMSWRFDEGE